jgi:cellulose synthase operon protein C
MSRLTAVRLLLLVSLVAGLFAGCSRDPNVRKQKYLESGNRYRDKGKLREAAIQYSNAVQVDPLFAEAHFQLGETYLKLGDGERGGEQLVRAVDLAPDNYQARTDLANLLVMSARNPDGSPRQNYQDLLKQAQTHLDFLHEKQPNSADTHLAWARYYAAQDNLASALQEMQKAVDADPNRSETYLNLAVLQDRDKHPEKAEISFKKAAELAPKAMNAQLDLGRFYQERNRLLEAEQQFKHAIDVDPKDPAPREALVQTMMAEGKKDEIEAFLKQTKSDLSDNSEGYRMLGDFYYFVRKDIPKATAEYGSLYHDHPRDPLVKRNYIQLLILVNRLDEATKLNDEILKTNPHEVDSLICRGQIQLRHNDAAGAVDSLQQALKNDPDNAQAHYQLGLAFDAQNNDARAESEWHESIRLRPDLTDAERALAALEIRRGDLDALTTTAQQIITNVPYSPDGYVWRALAEMNRKRYGDAEQDLRKAQEFAPQSAVPWVQTGNLRQIQGQYGEAIKSYQQALDKDPTSTDALQGMMNTYLAEKQPDQAVAAAQTQIAKSPSNGGFYDLLGTALFQKKDLSGADAAFRKAVELDKTNSDALLKLGQVQAAEGSVDQALATYQQSIKDHPRDIALYILAGEMYASQNKWDQAKDMYQKALAIQSDNPLASNNLAYVILQQSGNIDVALAMAQTARRGMPDSPNVADTLGWAYYQKGVYQSAIEMFQEALRLNEKNGAPDDPTVHFHLGLAYQRTKQPLQARQQLERALKLDPNNPDARKALSELRG